MRTVILSLFLLGCSARPVTPNPPDADASVHVDGGDACYAACVTLVNLGCPEGNPSSGASCIDVCVHTEQTGVFELKPSCIASARTVDGVKACGTVRCDR